MTRPHSPTSTLFLLCSLLILSVYSADFTFNENGEFTILQFTDFHYCESDDKDANTLALQRRLMDIVKPDLIMVSGDAVSGFISNATGFYENCWKKFTQPFIDTQTYYAYTLGNHDAESDLNRTQIVQLDKTNPFSVLATADSVPDTATFRIPIWSYQNKSHLAAHIWIFDSGSVGCDGISTSWGCILDSHIEWYNQETKQIKKQYGTDVHHVAYYHIPIPEYLDVYNFDEIYGSSNDTVGCPLVNTGFFSAVQKNGDISAMFVGHDHSNDFGGWQGGVEFVYGRKSGYGSYGDVRGARVLKFEEMVGANGTVVVTREHYIIQEDGDILVGRNESKRPGPIEPTCDTPGLAEVAGLNATTKPKFLDIIV